MTAARTNTFAADELWVEIPFAFDADEHPRMFWISGTVKLGAERAWLTDSITVIDQRTLHVEEIRDDDALEKARHALIEAAKELAKKAWT